MPKESFSLVLHGGAWVVPGADYTQEIAHMRGLIEQGRDRLRAGASAVDVVVEIVAAQEDSALYIAGRGASPNLSGDYELDASVMDGATCATGAVAILQGFANPVKVARAVMQATPHALLAGEGAAAFARAQGMKAIDDPARWFVPVAPTKVPKGAANIGTVGCVARDREGRLASATSTGGTLDKLPGRTGDTPVIGTGFWADDSVAVSCTGKGEYFMRTAAAVQVAHRMRWRGEDVRVAARAAIEDVVTLGGVGGLIALDAAGNIAMPFSAEGMKRAALLPDGQILAEAF